VIIINDYLYRKFADTLLYLAPGFPMDATGVVYHIKTKGFDSFCDIADVYDPGLTASAELLTRLGKGGKQYG